MLPHETTFLDVFKQNPLPFLLILMLAFAGLALGIVALVLALTRGSRAIAIVAIAVGVLPIGVGMGAWALAQSRMDVVLTVPGLTEDDRRRLRAAGDEEAWIVARTGLFGAAPGLGLGVLGLLLGGSKRRKA